MKSFRYILFVVITIFLLAGCSQSRQNDENPDNPPQYKFPYYGIKAFDDVTPYQTLVATGMGEASRIVDYEYFDLFDDKGRKILPLFNIYMKYMTVFITRAEWDNYDGKGRRLVLYFASEYFRDLPGDTPFWGYLAYPEEEDSVLNLYTEK
mgnify:CR=1 FL=1